MAGAGQRRSDWNRALLEEGAAAAYAQVLVAATASLAPADFYRLWPLTMPPEPWSLLVRALYTALADLPVLHVAAAAEPTATTTTTSGVVEASDEARTGSSGRWVAPSGAILPTDDLRRNAPLAAALRGEA